MLQVATFTLPAQQQEANEFLRTHRPDGQIHFNTDMIVVFYDDGVVSPEWEVAELQELLRGNANATFQQEVALHVLQTQLADLKEEKSRLNAKHNKGRYEEVDNLIFKISGEIVQVKQAIAMQGIKAEFVKGRITKVHHNK